MILTVLKEGVPKWATWQALKSPGCSWGSTQTAVKQGMLGSDVAGASIYTHLQPCAGSLSEACWAHEIPGRIQSLIPLMKCAATL